ncbi:MAG: hypothetical protein KAJ24_00855, partial [Candidatus Aenigmarchaeota archaeon]|nr:hypothetical protein [Candidatus Aenigmarchaeota archaeon]
FKAEGGWSCGINMTTIFDLNDEDLELLNRRAGEICIKEKPAFCKSSDVVDILGLVGLQKELSHR